MSIVVQSMNIFPYFDNLVDPTKANNLHFYCIATSLHHISTIIKTDGENYRRHCFKFLFYCLLVRTLLSKGYKDIVYLFNGKTLKIIWCNYVLTRCLLFGFFVLFFGKFFSWSNFLVKKKQKTTTRKPNHHWLITSPLKKFFLMMVL